MKKREKEVVKVITRVYRTANEDFRIYERRRQNFLNKSLAK